MNQYLTQRRTLTLNPDTILEGCRRNDLLSQQQLYKLYYPDMIRICYRYAGDADGAGIIYNNAMLKIFKNIGNYTEEGKLSSWIKTIVIHCSIDFCKKKNIFKNAVPSIAEDLFVLEPDAFDKLSAREGQVIIAELPEATAAVFNLFIYEGYTHKQIAEILGISEGTSKWHVSEAKKQLKEKLKNYFNNNELKTNAAG